MNKSSKYDKLWCAPEYKKMIKAEAARQGMSIYDFTKQMVIKGKFIPVEKISNEKAFKFRL